MDIMISERLKLLPLTDTELAAQRDAESDPHMRSAYAQMLEGCMSFPDARLWYTSWNIYLKEDGEYIGDLCFKGPAINGEVELGYGIDEAYRCMGYATEAARAAEDWAFSHPDVSYVAAETEPDNTASRRVLAKLGYAN